jgi:hypothetical protein
VPGPDDRDDHLPLLTRALVAVAGAACALASPAAAGRVAALPSPVAPVSPAPPLEGGATSSAESVRHRVRSATAVHVSVDATGVPFRVVATQRLDVRVLGDYFFTVGAPVVVAARAPGSGAAPGYRPGAVVWAGFDPGRRILAARITLEPARAARSLPLAIRVGDGRTVLVNATRVRVPAYAADAEPGPLRRFLAVLAAAARTGATPLAATATITSTPVAVPVSVAAPLRVRGTIGGRAVSLLLQDRAVIPATGHVDLRVDPVAALPVAPPGAGGRALLDTATRAALTLARVRQYESFLGNPDPAGASRSSYRYVTAARPTAAPPPSAPGSSSRWTTALALVATGAALMLGLVAWSRS